MRKKNEIRKLVEKAEQLVRRYGIRCKSKPTLVSDSIFKFYRDKLLSLSEDEFIDFLLAQSPNCPFKPLSYVRKITKLTFLHYALYYEKYLLVVLIGLLHPEFWFWETGSGKKMKQFIKNEEKVKKIMKNIKKKIKGGNDEDSG